jgi:histidine triad (HIT) family protein
MTSSVRQRTDRFLPRPLRYLALTFARLYYSMSSCVFCKIVQGEAQATVLYTDEQVMAFRDSHPVAPTHILIVPKRHIDSLNDIQPQDEALVGHMFLVARRLAKEEGIAESGYRTILNTGAHGGQTIFHLHLHLIGGQRMRHPMG